MLKDPTTHQLTHSREWELSLHFKKTHLPWILNRWLQLSNKTLIFSNCRLFVIANSQGLFHFYVWWQNYLWYVYRCTSPDCSIITLMTSFSLLTLTLTSRVTVTQQLITSCFAWQNINSDIQKWARSCIQCQRSIIHHHTITPLSAFATPNNRFEKVHLDIVSPPSQGYTYLVTIINRFTRCPKVIVLHLQLPEPLSVNGSHVWSTLDSHHWSWMSVRIYLVDGTHGTFRYYTAQNNGLPSYWKWHCWMISSPIKNCFKSTLQFHSLGWFAPHSVTRYLNSPQDWSQLFSSKTSLWYNPQNPWWIFHCRSDNTD